MSHHDAPEGWPSVGEQPDGTFTAPAPLVEQGGLVSMAGTPQERFESGVYSLSVDDVITDDMRQRAAEIHANALVDIRGFIDNQINTLCGDDLDSHFALQAVLGGMIKLGRQQTKNG